MKETDGQLIKGNLLHSTDHSHFLCLAILITVTIRAHHFLSETHSCFLLAGVKFKLPSLDLARPTLSLVAIPRSAPSALDRKRLLWVPGQQRRWQHERLVLGVGAPHHTSNLSRLYVCIHSFFSSPHFPFPHSRASNSWVRLSSISQ